MKTTNSDIKDINTKMETTNKQLTEQELQDLQRYAEQLERIEKEVANNFSRYKRKNNTFRVSIEEDGKVNKIAKLKDYLNLNTIDYNLAICFAGGSYWKDYTTILAIEIID